MAIETYLTDDEQIYRRTLGAVNAYGEKAETWPLVATVKGIIQPKSESVARADSGITITGDAILYTLATANIKEADKVVDPSGVSWNVLAVLNQAGRNHHYKVVLGLVK